MPIGFPLDFLHGVSPNPIGSRDKTTRNPGFRFLFTQAMHIERRTMFELIVSPMYARSHVIDDDSVCCLFSSEDVDCEAQPQCRCLTLLPQFRTSTHDRWTRSKKTRCLANVPRKISLGDSKCIFWPVRALHTTSGFYGFLVDPFWTKELDWC